MALEHEELTEKIIGCVYTVSNALGAGFLEKVYENAMALELRSTGIGFEQQVKTPIKYRDEIVGDYIADLIVGREVILEIKACKGIDNNHRAQLLNYLKATGIPIGLILNFGTPRVEIKRMAL